jgi:outer membrane protein OmpA-like peptidoglycan-associated protein
MTNPRSHSPRLARALFVVLLACTATGCIGPFRRPFGRLQTVLRGEGLAPVNRSEDLAVIRGRRTLPYTVNMEIRKGDTLRTGPGARALVHFREGYQAFIGPNAEVVIHNPSIGLARGQTYVRKVVPRPRRRFTARTRYTVVGTRSTEFFVSAGPGGSTVAVVTGAVDAASTGNPDIQVVVEELEQTRFPADSALAVPPPVIGLRNATRDSIRILVVDTRFVRDTFTDTVIVAPPVDIVEVPLLLDAPVDSVLARLDRAGLRLGPLAGPQPPSVPRWRAAEQSPPPGSRVPAGTPVTVGFVREAEPDTPVTHPPPPPYVAPEAALVERLRTSFEPAQSLVLAPDTATLAALAELLRRHPAAVLEVGGHADSMGPEAYNVTLSDTRARAIRTHLVEHYGIDPVRIRTMAYGESRPAASNATATGRATNRRVEFRLVLPAR